MSMIQKHEIDNMQEAKFISKVVTMGPNRFFIPFPKDHLKTAKTLKGKYVKVFVQEIAIEE